mgnify:CR=1 FL=1|jgi:predicted SprT family Zn-dependent metalloprotease
MISNKNRSIIEDVKISKEKLEKFNSTIKHSQYKHRVIRHYFGGVCTICAQIPIKVIKYDLGDGQLLEYYCKECFQRWIQKT